MFKIKNKIIDIIGNSIIFIAMVGASIVSCFEYYHEQGSSGMFFVYFTNLTAIMVGLISLIIAILEIKETCLPRIWGTIRFVSVVSALIVFLVVFLILNPVVWANGGTFYSLYTHSNFWFHLVNPLLVTFLFLFNEETNLEKKDVWYSLIPFVLYSIFYIIYVVILRNKDIYGLTHNYNLIWTTIDFFLMYGVALGVGWGTYALKKIISQKSQ